MSEVLRRANILPTIRKAVASMQQSRQLISSGGGGSSSVALAFALAVRQNWGPRRLVDPIVYRDRAFFL